MTLLQTRGDVLTLIAATPKGQPRKDVLEKYRDLVSVTGGGCVLYAPKKVEGKTFQQRLSQTYVGVLERLNARTGIPDGLGTFGGLGEYATPEQVEKDGTALLGHYDNVILDETGKHAKLTQDITIIARQNAAREAKEELQNLGITDYQIPTEELEHIPMPGVRDDNYIVNRWDGNGQAFAVTPYGHLLKVQESLLDSLQIKSQTNEHEELTEARTYQKMPLFEALKHWGKKVPQGAPNRSEDGRDLTYDYRYPHEYILTWVIAAKVLDGDEKAVLQLANEVQQKSTHFIDLKNMANQMGVTLKQAGAIIGVSEKTMDTMTRNMTAIYLASRQNSNNRSK